MNSLFRFSLLFLFAFHSLLAAPLLTYADSRNGELIEAKESEIYIAKGLIAQVVDVNAKEKEQLSLGVKDDTQIRKNKPKKPNIFRLIVGIIFMGQVLTLHWMALARYQKQCTKMLM